MPLRWIVSVVALLGAPGGAGAQPALYAPEEATVAAVHAAMAEGRLTCRQLVSDALARIDAYDDIGPTLNAIITINPRALERAEALDARRRIDPASTGPLHCIPVVLKDNFDTADLPTTGGSVALAESVPVDDAFVVARLRAAGGVVIAKANLTELARGGTTVSSLGGQTRNPYDLTRTPGGSSGGTGAAIAAGFGLLGTGSDTGQSIRSPASAASLVGLRPTRGLVSRDGVIPLSTTQDAAGPITRTVEDAARMLDVIAGYDPRDPVTAFSHGRIPETYTASLDADALRGARLGLLVDLLGTGPAHVEVNAVTEAAVDRMVILGATVIRFRIPNLERLTRDLRLGSFEVRSAFNGYLDDLGPTRPVRTMAELIETDTVHASIREGLSADEAVVDGLDDPEYYRRLHRRQALREAVMTAMVEHGLDAILYPHQRRLVARIGAPQLERNGVLSNGTGFPALTIPGGFSPPTASAPIGVPVGIELLGPEWSEPRLFALAYAFEQGARLRRPPRSTPRLR